MKLTAAQTDALMQLPADGSYGIPRSPYVHNGTLLALIRKDLVEWDAGTPSRIWQLKRGAFRLTPTGQAIRKYSVG